MNWKVARVKVSIVLSLMLINNSSFSKEQSPSQVQQEDTEQIEVIGSKPLYYYRQQMVKTELKFYDSLNNLLENPQYKVKCKKEAVRQGSRITQRACYPQYFLAKKAELTKIAMQTSGVLPSDADVELMVKQEKAASLAYIEKLVEQNPELKKQLFEMYQSKQIFLSKKENSK
ncbi:hypothetical protein [uncultured Paraglaciecola sp.]|uniref:hypothetical protein n=1 Tax=uncultured Paraglaciecola sp. TaxID=1765024 RepID=UPI0025987B58|nr:hypothetical protein [uncultured Paraglaciecola sp.]